MDSIKEALGAAVEHKAASNSSGSAKPEKDKRSPFGPIVCTIPVTAYVNDKRGRKSTVTLNCAVPIRSIGMTVETAVWATLDRDKNGDERITFEAGLPRGFKPESEYFSESFKAACEAAAAKWEGYAAAEAAAIARLTGAAKKNVERPGLKARLVKRSAA